jgi:hypothetical protein
MAGKFIMQDIIVSIFVNQINKLLWLYVFHLLSLFLHHR